MCINRCLEQAVTFKHRGAYFEDGSLKWMAKVVVRDPRREGTKWRRYTEWVDDVDIAICGLANVLKQEWSQNFRSLYRDAPPAAERRAKKRRV